MNIDQWPFRQRIIDAGEGNPGAIAAICAVATHAAADEKEFTIFLDRLEEKGLRGERIWRAFKSAEKNPYTFFIKVWAVDYRFDCQPEKSDG